MAKILVIDDSEFIVASVRDALAPLGHEVITIQSFLKLIDLIHDDPPDLILLDIEMPMLPGKKAGEYIRKYEKSPIPLLVHSSRPKQELSALSDSLGANGFVAKQDGMPSLVSKIKHTLARAK